MYNGIGLTTPRGSGTNGHVQRNWAFVRPNKKDNANYRSEEDIKKLDASLNRPPNKEILDHDRKRKIEVKCIEFEEILEKQGRTPEEIKTQVDLYRQKLMGQGKTDLPKDEFGRVAVRETHQVAEAQQEKNSKLREAFNISEYFVEGSSFDSDRKAKEDLAKSVALQKELDAQRAVAAAAASAVGKEKDRYALIRTPSKEREIGGNNGAAADVVGTKSVDRERGVKSDRKKKKKRTRESSASPERKKDKKKKSKKHKKENKSKKKKSRKRKHSTSDSGDSDDHDSDAEDAVACSSDSDREVTRKQRKKAKKEKRKRDRKKRKDRGHSTDSSRSHSPDKKSNDYKSSRNVEKSNSREEANRKLDAKNPFRKSRSLERRQIAVGNVKQYQSPTKSRSSTDSRRSRDRKKESEIYRKKDGKERDSSRKSTVSRDRRHRERSPSVRKESKDSKSGGCTSRHDRSPSRERRRKKDISSDRQYERSKSKRGDRFKTTEKQRATSPGERETDDHRSKKSKALEKVNRYKDVRRESSERRQRRKRSRSKSSIRDRSELRSHCKDRRDSRSHSRISKGRKIFKKSSMTSPPREPSKPKHDPSEVKRTPFNPFKAAEDTINDILGTNNPFKSDKATAIKSPSDSSSSHSSDSEDARSRSVERSKRKPSPPKIAIQPEGGDKLEVERKISLKVCEERPTSRQGDNKKTQKSRRSRSKSSHSIKKKSSEIDKRERSRPRASRSHTPELVKKVKEVASKNAHQSVSTHSSRNSSELSYSPARRNPERYRDILTVSSKQEKNNSRKDHRSMAIDNIRGKRGTEKDATLKPTPICTQSDDESDSEKLGNLDEYQQMKREREREQQELRLLEQLKSGIAAKAKQKIEMMATATNGGGQTSGDVSDQLQHGGLSVGKRNSLNEFLVANNVADLINTNIEATAAITETKTLSKPPNSTTTMAVTLPQSLKVTDNEKTIKVDDIKTRDAHTPPICKAPIVAANGALRSPTVTSINASNSNCKLTTHMLTHKRGGFPNKTLNRHHNTNQTCAGGGHNSLPFGGAGNVAACGYNRGNRINHTPLITATNYNNQYFNKNHSALLISRRDQQQQHHHHARALYNNPLSANNAQMLVTNNNTNNQQRPLLTLINNNNSSGSGHHHHHHHHHHSHSGVGSLGRHTATSVAAAAITDQLLMSGVGGGQGHGHAHLALHQHQRGSCSSYGSSAASAAVAAASANNLSYQQPPQANHHHHQKPKIVIKPFKIHDPQPLVAALADSSLVDAIVSKVSTATVAAAESAARRSRSRSRRSQSRSRRANSRHHQRSSSRSRSRSRYSSSSSRSQRSSRSRTHSQSSHSSCSSRSSSGSSSSYSSGSSRTGSRSPSIPRRRGSPSFLDRRRITSARKRPIPYHRKTPSDASSYCSSCLSRAGSSPRTPSLSPGRFSHSPSSVAF